MASPEVHFEDWEHRECPTCEAKPGNPTLCDACIHNQTAIYALKAVCRGKQHDMEALAAGMMKFAPDLMTRFIERWQAADGALDEFLAALRKMGDE